MTASSTTNGLTVRRDGVGSSSTEIEDENVALAMNLLLETVGEVGSSGFNDDTEVVHSGHGAGALGNLTLPLSGNNQFYARGIGLRGTRSCKDE